MGNLQWEKFEGLFGDWTNRIKPFFDSGGFDPIYEKLKLSGKMGVKIAPLSSNVFRAFEECPFDDLKLVVVGMSPYHTLKQGNPIADGLAMSCSITNYPQPTLDQWYYACEKELNEGMCLPCIKNPDLKFLANQGVLLLNAGLTVEIMKAGSHNTLWEPFMKYLFEEIINLTGVPVIFLGKEAAQLEQYTAPYIWTFKPTHPASATYKGIDWDSGGIFKDINKILWDRNKLKINWFDNPEDDEIPF